MKHPVHDYGVSWTSQILSNLFRKMSSFSNSFDSEIVLLGNQKNMKHSRVGVSNSDDDEHDDLNIQDSVSVRTFSSNPATPDEQGRSRATTATFQVKAPQFLNEKTSAFPPHSAVFSANSNITRKRKISKVKSKTKTQKEELVEAVIKGDLQKIEDIIDVLDLIHGRGIFVVMSYQYSYNINTDVVKTQEDEDPYLDKYSKSLNIIHITCIFDQDQVVDFLCMYGVNKIKQFLASDQCLDPGHTAAWYGAVGALHSLKKNGFNIIAENEQGATTLHTAAERNNKNVVDYLINFDEEILNKEDKIGRTALHYAAENSCFECVKVLINHGANVDKMDNDGNTPLQFSSHNDVITYLLKHGADPALKTSDGRTVLSHILESVPSEFPTVLSNYLQNNSQSLAAKDLEIKIDFNIWEAESSSAECDGILNIVKANEIEFLKHPVVESFIHLKYELIGRLYNRLDMAFYTIFLLR